MKFMNLSNSMAFHIIAFVVAVFFFADLFYRDEHEWFDDEFEMIIKKHKKMHDGIARLLYGILKRKWTKKNDWIDQCIVYINYSWKMWSLSNEIAIIAMYV